MVAKVEVVLVKKKRMVVERIERVAEMKMAVVVVVVAAVGQAAVVWVQH